MTPQRGFTLLEMLAALAVLALCASVLVTAFGQGARALQQAQRSDRLSLAARSLLDEARNSHLAPGRTTGRWSGVDWTLTVTQLPDAAGPAIGYGLVLTVTDGVRQGRYSTLQVRRRPTAALP
ncbi:prepilin-type N-terminal cleavage/methylation domain-containing protein [Pseudomonas sp. LY10J]|uniref:Prepilin-type N-terminal cleavage/methylation domain-containing protein n=1 Tax=Pseudomonas quercus TaxID=2722792 RepID=A0ABX0YIU5_9PSED|nr:prepilin-type N-terminal cleavage/methylation domain-containing protein [Pseudomonas sp. LY10J]MBF7143817.1 prepilin-type N-terminal cleavage/methylation domain-containing protein [Pseudomonas sp. LY10J]NJP02104.1 prepilin-type N-terminal cleavage/methylation domain-containing protein [Pseudomonas quercus]